MENNLGINLEIKDISKWFNKIPFLKILLFFNAVLSVLLFSPDSILNKLFLKSFCNKYSEGLGISFVFCFVALVLFLLSKLVLKVRTISAFTGRNAKRRFEMLSEEALDVVLKMYNSPNYSRTMSLESATATILYKYSFVGRPSYGSGDLMFQFFLQPWVIKYLDKHSRKFLKTPK